MSLPQLKIKTYTPPNFENQDFGEFMPDANGITLAEAQNALAEAIAARSAFVGGGKGVKSYKYTSGGSERSVTREDLASLNQDIIFWDGKVRQLSRGGITVRGVTLLP